MAWPIFTTDVISTVVASKAPVGLGAAGATARRGRVRHGEWELPCTSERRARCTK